MNVTVAITFALASLAALGASLAWRLGRAPVWSDLRRFAGVAAFTALYGVVEGAEGLVRSERQLVAIAGLLGATSVLVSWSWLRYTDVVCHRAPLRAERWLRLALLAVAPVCLIPGIAFDAGGGVRSTLTPFGVAVASALIAGGLLIVAHLLRAWRAGYGGAGAIALSFGAAIPLAASDILGHAGWSDAPHVLGLGLALPLAVASWVVGTRFLADAGSLHELRARLEGLVEERTRELAEANAALLQAEKLAALGQFAAGVAHEVNNPASVVTANLALLSEGLARSEPLPDQREIVDESLEAMRRINELVRKLLDAGRLADLPPGSGNVQLAGAVDHACRELRANLRLDVELVNRVPDDLLVRGGADVVGRIVSNLMSNAVEAIPHGRKGHVEVSARAEGPLVRLVVEDDGAGMPIDVLRRAFDPFFTTKPTGRGSGLGLPITRGLVEGIGGQIWLESEPEKGTRAAVELPLATPA